MVTERVFLDCAKCQDSIEVKLKNNKWYCENCGSDLTAEYKRIEKLINAALKKKDPAKVITKKRATKIAKKQESVKTKILKPKGPISEFIEITL